MDIRKFRHIAILGCGESGMGSALLAKKQGFECFVSDSGEIKPEFRADLEDLNIRYEQNTHTRDKILSSDLIIKSPGLDEKTEIMTTIRKSHVPVISEIEFAYHFCKGKIIGITGSNGKTTTTMLTYSILKNAGFDATYGGNVGVSFARRVAEGSHRYYVLEISSFQLDDIVDFKCDVALLLNITPDHLDRYHYNMAEYAESKMRICNKQKQEDYFIYNADDAVILQYLEKIRPQGFLFPFSQKATLSKGAFLSDEKIILKQNNKKSIEIDMNILSLIGTHNRYNSMAASAAAYAIDIKDEVIRKSLSSFQNIEHRLEFVAKIHGVDYLNDSKATNVNSTWYALESMSKPTIWIVGGVDKGNDYSELKPLVEEKVKAIICLGTDNQKIIDAFRDVKELIFDTSDINEAVEIAYKLAVQGDVVLLSPACASFDLFRNYEERGNKFKEAVRNL